MARFDYIFHHEDSTQSVGVKSIAQAISDSVDGVISATADRDVLTVITNGDMGDEAIIVRIRELIKGGQITFDRFPMDRVY